MTTISSEQHHKFALGDGLTITASADPASDVLGRFFEGYDRAFVLPDEREELAGFQKCLALNTSYRHAFGRMHNELVMVLEGEDGQLLGGANFLATRMSGRRGFPPATVALNYLYIEDAVRGRGMLRKALVAVRRLALLALDLDPAVGQPLVFIEQNDPLRLTPAEYALDTAHSGLDQIDRLAIWSRVGARIVDFPYVQPPLSADQQPDDGLVYAAINPPGGTLDPMLLHDHLESFFRISVLKGKEEPPGGTASAQLEVLARMRDAVPILDMAPALEWLRNGRSTDGIASLANLARKATEK